jgi:hypothetical protein
MVKYIQNGNILQLPVSYRNISMADENYMLSIGPSTLLSLLVSRSIYC